MTFNQTVVGSNPAALIIIKNHWNFLVKHNSREINFNWVSLYIQFYNILLKNFILVNNFNNFLLKSKLSVKLNVLGKHTLFNKSVVISKPIVNRDYTLKGIQDQPTFNSKKLCSIKFFKPIQQINLFNLYLHFSNNTTNTFFVPHTNFKPLFISQTSSLTPFINISKLFTKWVNSYNFLLNIFFNKLNMFLFSNKIFKNEIISFNWSSSLLDYRLFKYSSPYFYMKDTNFGVPSSIIFKRFVKKGLNTTFVLDLKQHEKNLYFLKSINLHVIGLVPYSMNPWLVSYALPVASNNIFIQYFFIKTLLFIKQYSEVQLYNNLKSTWLSIK